MLRFKMPSIYHLMLLGVSVVVVHCEVKRNKRNFTGKAPLDNAFNMILEDPIEESDIQGEFLSFEKSFISCNFYTCIDHNSNLLKA